MLCISAAYAIMRTDCVSVCLSVCVSVTFVSSVETSKHIIKIFSPSGSHTILVFLHQTGWRYSNGNPPNGGAECKGVSQSHELIPISDYISELMQDRAIVTMESE